MELPRRVSLAALDACRRYSTATLGLKWPNDVLLDDRKVAGVLAQRAPSGSIVVGIGINVGWAPDGASRLGPEVRPTDLLVELLTAYDRLPSSAYELRDRYRSELATLGRRVRVELPDGEVLGVATDIAIDGRLVVVADGGTVHRLSVGDVVHLRAM
jgi:BirA family biotin operon repressor/biotin-[acetyl-CoA-carboxylase] ligase